jgi:hypothetical protein
MASEATLAESTKFAWAYSYMKQVRITKKKLIDGKLRHAPNTGLSSVYQAIQGKELFWINGVCVNNQTPMADQPACQME